VIFKNPSAEPEPVHFARHPNITENQIYRATGFFENSDCVSSAVGLPDGEAFVVKMGRQGDENQGFVFNDQHHTPLRRQVASRLETRQKIPRVELVINNGHAIVRFRTMAKIR
jgi:hypothetical protein